MKYYPFNISIINKTWCLKILSKTKKIDPLWTQSIKLHSSFFEKIMRLTHNFFFINIKFKVELPCANGVGYIAFFIRNCKSNLNEFGLLNIAFDEKVLCLLLWSWSLEIILVDINSWKLSVLCNLGHTIAITLNFSVILISFVISSSKLWSQTSQMRVSGKDSSSRTSP